MNHKVESLLTGLVTGLAVIVGGLFLYQQLATRSAPALAEPIDAAAWNEFLHAGTKIGPVEARAQVVEFGDFQCPFCAQFHRHIEGLMTTMPGDIGLTYLHYPLPQHPHAHEAVIAAECASQQDRFAAIAHELYANQDAIGAKPWADFAMAAGVDDLTAFQRCMAEHPPTDIIEKHAALAAMIAVTGTPTVVLNGWRFRVPPHPDTLRSYVTQLIAGGNPFTNSRRWKRR